MPTDIAALITCPICHGSGDGSLGAACATCNGTGREAVYISLDPDALTVLALALPQNTVQPAAVPPTTQTTQDASIPTPAAQETA